MVGKTRQNGALTLTRHLYRVMIAGDTNSDAKNSRGVPRMPHHHIQIRATTTFPRPAAAAAGKFNSSTTHLRAPICGGLGYAPRHWALRVRQPCGVLANQLNFPAASAAPEPCARARTKSVLMNMGAPGSGSAYASGRGRWWCGGGRCRIKNSAGHFASVVPRSNPPAQPCCPVEAFGNTKSRKNRGVTASVVPLSNPPAQRCCPGRGVWEYKDSEIPRGLFVSVVPRSNPPEHQRCSGRDGGNTKDAEIPRRVFASLVPRSSPPKQRCSGRGGVCFHAGTLRIDSGGKISCREDFFLWAAFLPHFCVSCKCHSLSLLLRRCCES